MTVWKAILWMLGAAALLAGVCYGVILRERDEPDRKYDERQQNARGRGYRFAFWVGAAYFVGVMLYAIQWVEDGPPAVEPYLLMWFGFLLELLALHAYGLFTQSALPFSQSPLVVAGSYLVVGGSQLFSFFIQPEEYAGMPLTGRGSVKWAYLSMAVTGFLLSGAYLVTWLRGRRKEDG